MTGLQKSFAAELRERLEKMRSGTEPQSEEKPVDIRLSRYLQRAAQVQGYIESEVPDKRLHWASNEALGDVGLDVSRSFAEADRSHYVYGGKGYGKSFLGVAAMRCALLWVAHRVSYKEDERHFDSEVDTLWMNSVKFISHDALIRALQACYRDKTDPAEVLGAYCDARYLILDDLGARTKLSQFAADETGTLIDARYTAGAATLFTSNLSLPEFSEAMDAAGPKMGARAESRIWGLLKGTGLGPKGSDLYPDAGPILAGNNDRRMRQGG